MNTLYYFFLPLCLLLIVADCRMGRPGGKKCNDILILAVNGSVILVPILVFHRIIPLPAVLSWLLATAYLCLRIAIYPCREEREPLRRAQGLITHALLFNAASFAALLTLLIYALTGTQLLETLMSVAVIWLLLWIFCWPLAVIVTMVIAYAALQAVVTYAVVLLAGWLLLCASMILYLAAPCILGVRAAVRIANSLGLSKGAAAGYSILALLPFLNTISLLLLRRRINLEHQ